MNSGSGLKYAWLLDFVLINGKFFRRMFMANICYKACGVVPNVFVKIYTYIYLIVK